MDELVMLCCECLEPMAQADYPFARSGERWYRCDTHGFWDESEVGAIVVVLSAYEILRRDGWPMLPLFAGTTGAP